MILLIKEMVVERTKIKWESGKVFWDEYVCIPFGVHKQME
jgi:hypothetical protein